MVRKRRSRPRSVHHDPETGAAVAAAAAASTPVGIDSNQAAGAGDAATAATAAAAPTSPGVQIHPVAIEAALPLGKKVRLENGAIRVMTRVTS